MKTMKMLLMVLLVGIMASGIVSGQNRHVTVQNKVSAGGITTYTLSAGKVDHAVASYQNKITTFAELKSVTIDPATGTVMVTTNSSLSEAKVGMYVENYIARLQSERNLESKVSDADVIAKNGPNRPLNYNASGTRSALDVAPVQTGNK